jgi:hypothetical protein
MFSQIYEGLTGDFSNSTGAGSDNQRAVPVVSLEGPTAGGGV